MEFNYYMENQDMLNDKNEWVEKKLGRIYNNCRSRFPTYDSCAHNVLQLHNQIGMMSSLSGLGAMKLFPVTQRYDVHDVEYFAGEDFGYMPKRFTRRYFDDVPSNVVITDPAGNEFDVMIIRQLDRVVLTGCLKIGKFYGLHLGGDFRMVYLGMGRFIMQVFTNYGDEVVYPPLITSLPVVASTGHRVGSAMENGCRSGSLC